MMKMKCLIFVLCGTLVTPYSFDVKSSVEIHNQSHTMVLAIDRILEDFISKQSNSLFVCQRTTLQSSDELKPIELLDEFLQSMSYRTKIAFVITADDYQKPIHRHNLLIVDGFESFSEIYGTMTSNYDFDSNGYFVIALTTGSEGNHHDTVHNILVKCWEWHAANVVILVPTENYRRTLLYTFFPYSEEHCEQVKPIQRNYFENGAFKLNVAHFPAKCENFHQCSLHVAATDDPPYTFLPADAVNKTSDFSGLDAMVLKEISRRLNFNMIVWSYAVFTDDEVIDAFGEN